MSRGLQITFKNIRRTPYQAIIASMVMFLTFFALSIFLLLAYFSQKVLIHYESKPQVIAFFKDGTTQSDINAIQNALKQTGKVSSLSYVSKEEALQIYKERNKSEPALLELVSANILPASLEISTTSPEALGPIAEILKKEPVIGEVVYPEDVVKALSNTTKAIRWIGGGAVTFLIFFATLIILTIVGFKLRLKRKEIEIMRLLGASTWYIRAPFIYEGIIYSLLGAIIAWLIAYLIVFYIGATAPSDFNEAKLFPVSPAVMFSLLAIEVLVALFIGFLASFGAVRRYLKV